ncbi:hypothetical protein ACROSR_10240 [Roseovarius tibetensis]|uniref:hypothetical protein n=1 Tax=Roseovarius tibetensis TaxID=2685897 RepID=UPI003D7F2D91
MTDTETMHDQTPSAQAGADRMTPDGSTFMRVLSAGMLALALGLAIPALAQEDQDQAAQDSLDVEEVQSEIDEAFETISEYSADQRDEALVAVRESLNDIDTEIARLEQRARENWADMSEATQTRTRNALDDLRERRNELSEAFGALGQGADSAWDELQDGLADAWSGVKGAWTAVFDGSDEASRE